MNPIRRKMASLLSEAAYNQLGYPDPQSPLIKELGEIEDIESVIAEEIDRICNTATLDEITKAFLLARKLKTASAEEKKTIKDDINSMTEKLVKRVEAGSSPLRLSKICRHLLSEL